jgi:uncharacterized protein
VRLVQTAEIDRPADVVWDFVTDIPRVATCVPGAADVVPAGRERWRGTLRVRIGPIGLALAGELVVVSQDAETRSAELRVEAADPTVNGAVDARMTMQLEPIDGAAPSTKLTMTTDARVLGRLGEFGQPIIRRKADDLMRRFADNLAAAMVES